VSVTAGVLWLSNVFRPVQEVGEEQHEKESTVGLDRKDNGSLFQSEMVRGKKEYL